MVKQVDGRCSRMPNTLIMIRCAVEFVLLTSYTSFHFITLNCFLAGILV